MFNIISISTLVYLIENVSDYRIQAVSHQHKLEMLNTPISVVLVNLNVDGNGVDKLEFILGILSQLGLVDETTPFIFSSSVCIVTPSVRPVVVLLLLC